MKVKSTRSWKNPNRRRAKEVQLLTQQTVENHHRNNMEERGQRSHQNRRAMSSLRTAATKRGLSLLLRNHEVDYKINVQVTMTIFAREVKIQHCSQLASSPGSQIFSKHTRKEGAWDAKSLVLCHGHMG